MGVRKVSNRQSDLQGHSRSLVLVPFDATFYFPLVFHCNCVSVLYHFRDIIGYFSNFIEVTWLWAHPVRG